MRRALPCPPLSAHIPISPTCSKIQNIEVFLMMGTPPRTTFLLQLHGPEGFYRPTELPQPTEISASPRVHEQTARAPPGRFVHDWLPYIAYSKIKRIIATAVATDREVGMATLNSVALARRNCCARSDPVRQGIKNLPNQ